MKKKVRGNSSKSNALKGFKNRISKHRFTQGQISIFIIVGILIVAVALGALYMKNKSNMNAINMENFQNYGFNTQAKFIEKNIISCFQDSSKEALVDIGIHGGYFDRPADALDLGWAFIPYYFIDGKEKMPQRSEIEEEIAKSVEEKLTSCLEGLDFPGFTIRQGEPQVSASIVKGSVNFKSNMKITMQKSDETSEFELRKFPFSIKSKVYSILEVARYIVDYNVKNPGLICISCIADLSEERDIYVDKIDISEDSSLFIISDNSTEKDIYSYEFIIKYDELDHTREASVPAAPQDSVM